MTHDLATDTATALKDLTGSVHRMPLALSLALDDVRGRYRRTVLGPFWIVLGQAATIAGFVLVFSGLFRTDPNGYALYLAAGFPIWMMISSYLTDMPNALIQSRGLLESFELPWLLQIWRRSLSYLFVFAHQILVFFATMALLQVPPRWEMLWAIPGVFILTVAGSGLGVILATLGARYRDIHPAMNVASAMLFFFSAVVWRDDQLQENRWILDINPVYHMLKLVRDPLIGQPPSIEVFLAAGLGAAAMVALGFFVFASSRKRLYHWL